MLYLGDICFDVGNRDKAISYYRKAWSEGDKNATSYLEKCYKSSAEAGDVETMLQLGQVYEGGHGISIDSKKAADWYQHAADSENASPSEKSQALWHLGNLYLKGSGVARNLDTAFDYYNRAARTDEKNADARISLAAMYASGKGCHADKEKAKRLLNEAKELGSRYATNRLNRLLVAMQEESEEMSKR